MSDAPVIVTERLELWRPRYADLRPVFEVVSHPQTGTFLGPAVEWVDHYNRFHRNAGGWALHGYGNFVVRPRGRRLSARSECSTRTAGWARIST